MTDYLMGFYLGITILTTVGYGDANGKTEIQRIVIIFYIFIGVSLYSMIINEFSNMIFNTDQDSVDLENQVLQVKRYQKDYDLLPFIGDKIEQFYKTNFFFNRNNRIHPKYLKDDVPSVLRNELVLFLNRRVFDKIKLF